MVPAEETMDETISRIVSQYSPMLLRLAYARLGSAADAEDAVQETFLQLVSLRPNFRDAEHEKAWLIRTTLCRASDIRRRADRRALSLEEAALAAAPPPSLSPLPPSSAAPPSLPPPQAARDRHIIRARIIARIFFISVPPYKFTFGKYGCGSLP